MEGILVIGGWFWNGGLIPLYGLCSEICQFLAVGIWHNWLLSDCSQFINWKGPGT